jgi:hypothetical protein
LKTPAYKVAWSIACPLDLPSQLLRASTMRNASAAWTKILCRNFRLMSTVSDATAMVTFIDHQGAHHTVPGRVGQRLTDVAAMHGLQDILHCDASGGGASYEKVHSAEWTEDLFGEGAVSAISHVVISPQFFVLLKPPTPKELAMLTEVDPEDLSETSRLGSEIVLTKDLDGIKVFCQDSQPYDIP